MLVLHGDSDVALGVELLDGIEAVAPHSTVKVLKNCSHWCVQAGGWGWEGTRERGRWGGSPVCLCKEAAGSRRHS